MKKGSDTRTAKSHAQSDHTIGPRHRRLLATLLNATEITREQADRIAHANNSPQHISELRKKYGIPVQMRMVAGTDFDGKKVRYGVYSLDSKGKTIARQRLKEGCIDGETSIGAPRRRPQDVAGIKVTGV